MTPTENANCLRANVNFTITTGNIPRQQPAPRSFLCCATLVHCRWVILMQLRHAPTRCAEKFVASGCEIGDGRSMPNGCRLSVRLVDVTAATLISKRRRQARSTWCSPYKRRCVVPRYNEETRSSSCDG
jgi:hypothetical protein